MLFDWQLLIKASDQGTPERHASLTIYVKVKRSVRAPRFDGVPYQVQRISETKPVGRDVIKVTANDPDLQVRNLGCWWESWCQPFSLTRTFNTSSVYVTTIGLVNRCTMYFLRTQVLKVYNLLYLVQMLCELLPSKITVNP